MEHFILNVLKANLFAAICIAAILLASRFLNKKYSSYWRYTMWLVLSLFLLLSLLPFKDISVWKLEFSQEKTMPDHAASTLPGDAQMNQGKIIADSPSGTPAVKKVSGSVVENFSGHTLSSRLFQRPYLQFTLFIWLLGIFAVVVYRILTYYFYTKTLRRWAMPNTDRHITVLYQTVCAENNLKHPSKLMKNSKITGPLLAGIKKPCLYLPEASYTEEELNLIFSHEVFHHRHKDLWYKILLTAVNTIYWFNPAVYFMVKTSEKDLEYICDNHVTATHSSYDCLIYKRLLLKTAASLQNHTHYLSSNALVGCSVKEPFITPNTSSEQITPTGMTEPDSQRDTYTAQTDTTETESSPKQTNIGSNTAAYQDSRYNLTMTWKDSYDRPDLNLVGSIYVTGTWPENSKLEGSCPFYNSNDNKIMHLP